MSFSGNEDSARQQAIAMCANLTARVHALFAIAGAPLHIAPPPSITEDSSFDEIRAGARWLDRVIPALERQHGIAPPAAEIIDFPPPPQQDVMPAGISSAEAFGCWLFLLDSRVFKNIVRVPGAEQAAYMRKAKARANSPAEIALQNAFLAVWDPNKKIGAILNGVNKLLESAGHKPVTRHTLRRLKNRALL